MRRELQMRLRNLFISYVISTAMALLEGNKALSNLDVFLFEFYTLHCFLPLFS